MEKPFTVFSRLVNRRDLIPRSTLTTRLLLPIFSACLLFSGKASAASVSAAGYTNDFSTRPPAADWATTGRQGLGIDNYDMDSDVNANITAAGVTGTVGSSATNLPPASASATWSSTGHFLQTRPTNVRYTVLLGKFVNDSGTNATQVTISYSFSIRAPFAEDDGKGTRVYYSATGLANSWTNLPTLNVNSAVIQTLNLSTNLAINWPVGAPLYLLWADDNAIADPDPADQIDNFSLRVTAGSPLVVSCTIFAPTNHTVFVSGAPITMLATITNGTAPFIVEYFTNSGVGNVIFSSAGSSGTPPYKLTLSNLPAGVWNIHAIATDSAVPPNTANSQTNTIFIVDPLAVTLTSPTDGASLDHNTEVSGAVSVSGGTPSYSVQIYLDGSSTGDAVTMSPYSRNFGTLFVGDHTIAATVTDARGWTSNSLVSTVHITGPLGVRVTAPTNSASYTYGQAVTLTAGVGGGTAPYIVTLYTNDVPLESLASAPFTTNLGILGVGTCTTYARVMDSSDPNPAESTSTTNTFTIVENPLTVSLTSPTNGQTSFAGQSLDLTAVATVSAPITITRVELFLDGDSMAMDTTPPYSSSINPALGSHTVYALAIDSLDRVSYSATNQIIVKPASIISALANDLVNVVVTFSAAVNPTSATDSNYYTFNPSLTITGIQLLNPATVLISSSPRDPQFDYTISTVGGGPVLILRRNRNTVGGLAGVQTVFIILFENQDWSAIKGSTNAPYMNSLLPQASYCDQYYAHNNQHPSEPNYIYLEGGTNFGFTDDSGPAFDRIASTNHLATLLNNAGIDWRGYMESMPIGTTGTNSSGKYVGRHNPFAFYDDVTTDYNYATNHIRPYSYFAGDLAAGRIGRYNFITPNLTNDMHDLSPGSTSPVLQGDTWLSQELPAILNSPAFSNNGAVFLTFDESGAGGSIMMIVLSPLAKGNGYDSTTFYDQASTVRTMQDIFGVGPYLGGAATATNLAELFLTPRLTPIRNNGDAQIMLSDLPIGQTNHVQTSSDLVHWTTITNVAASAPNQTITVSDSEQPNDPHRFYRMVVAP